MPPYRFERDRFVNPGGVFTPEPESSGGGLLARRSDERFACALRRSTLRHVRVAPLVRRRADDLGDLQLVVLIPALPSEALGEAVADILPPRAERFLVLPPDDGQAFTILGLERLDVDEPRHRARQRVHLLG